MKGEVWVSVRERSPEAAVLELNVPWMVYDTLDGPDPATVMENVFPVMFRGVPKVVVLEPSLVQVFP
jgi:hypothetical protein